MNKSEIESQLIIALGQVSNQVEKLFDYQFYDLTFKQWQVLFNIATGKISNPSLTKIAKSCNCSRQNVLKIVLILQKKGYLVLTPSPLDQRAQTVTLTKKAFNYFRDFQNNLKQFTNQKFADTTIEELQVTLKVINSLLFSNIT